MFEEMGRVSRAHPACATPGHRAARTRGADLDPSSCPHESLSWTPSHAFPLPQVIPIGLSVRWDLRWDACDEVLRVQFISGRDGRPGD